MTELGSSPVPEPGDDDHRRAGERTPGLGAAPGGGADAPVLIVYADFECPFCAALHQRLERMPITVVFRHFPVRSSHPRAWPTACAAEAAALQGRFWEMHDSLLGDQAHLEDPHLWDRARALGLDLDRFDSDRRRDDVRERVQRDFRSGVRAGVVTTPALFAWRGGAAARVHIDALEGHLDPGG